jgi:transposase-like protein
LKSQFRQKYGNQRIVVGGIERDGGRVRLRVVPDRAQDTLETFLLAAITRDSLISTDAHEGYSDLEFYGWLHWQSVHARGQFRETNRIENVWSVAKRQLRRMYGQIRTDRLEEFLHEWEARRNFPKLFENPTAYLQVSLVPC